MQCLRPQLTYQAVDKPKHSHAGSELQVINRNIPCFRQTHLTLSLTFTLSWRYSSLVAFHLDQFPGSNEEPWPENMRHKSLKFEFWILKINPFGHL